MLILYQRILCHFFFYCYGNREIEGMISLAVSALTPTYLNETLNIYKTPMDTL